jgi:hypothetical protein
MTESDYKAFFTRLLSSFGGSYDAPTGWGEGVWYFSCARPPIVVPIPEMISAEQRRVIVEHAKAKFNIS